MDRVERITKALVDLDRAGGLLIGFINTLTPANEIKEAEETERQAQAAAEVQGSTSRLCGRLAGVAAAVLLPSP